MSEMFELEKITDQITRIDSITGESMFLAVGADAAALVDTGTGLGDLRRLIDSLTDKPVTVLLTHGHLDHAFGGDEFDEVYMSALDWPIVQAHKDMAMRMEYCQNCVDEMTLTEDMFHSPASHTHDLKDGDSFDLGGLTLEVYALPGHTPGSMTVLFKEERVLLTGDACNTGTFLQLPECLPLEEYRDKLIEYRDKMAGKYDTILLSHGHDRLTSELLDVVIDTCNLVLDGKDDADPMQFMGQIAYGAVKADPSKGYQRADGKRGNIVYNKRNLRRDKSVRK